MTTIQPVSGRTTTSVSFSSATIPHKLISASRQAREELLGKLGCLGCQIADKISDISQVDGFRSFGELRCGPYPSLFLYRLCS
jgi:hypothetical protein